MAGRNVGLYRSTVKYCCTYQNDRIVQEGGFINLAKLFKIMKLRMMTKKDDTGIMIVDDDLGEEERRGEASTPELIQGPGVLPNRGTSLYIRDIRKIGL
jgi:hypothetical protein